MTDYCRCPGCARPLSPWTPVPCSRCREAEDRRVLREWLEDHQ